MTKTLVPTATDSTDATGVCAEMTKRAIEQITGITVVIGIYDLLAKTASLPVGWDAEFGKDDTIYRSHPAWTWGTYPPMYIPRYRFESTVEEMRVSAQQAADDDPTPSPFWLLDDWAELKRRAVLLDDAINELRYNNLPGVSNFYEDYVRGYDACRLNFVDFLGQTISRYNGLLNSE